MCGGPSTGNRPARLNGVPGEAGTKNHTPGDDTFRRPPAPDLTAPRALPRVDGLGNHPVAPCRPSTSSPQQTSGRGREPTGS